MAVFFSSLSALVLATVTAAKAIATEILPPAAALAGDVAATAWSSAAWFIYYLRATVAAAVAVATDALPHAAAAARSAAQASRPFVAAALQLLSQLWSRVSSAAAVAGAAVAAAGEAPDVAKAVRNAAETAVRASQPWLDVASKLLRAFYDRVVVTAAAGEGSPVDDVAQAVKNAASTMAELSKPWLDMVSKQLRDLYGWLVATAAETKLMTDAAANACASASEKLIPASAAAPAAGAEIVHEWWSWFLHDRGVVVYVYVLLALALPAVAFVCGGVCALALRSRLADQEDHRRRWHPRQRLRVQRRLPAMEPTHP